MNERETNLLRSMDTSGTGFRAWIFGLVLVILWGGFAYLQQLRLGLVETGMRDQISWGLYISNFVFFIGISHAGTLISAILRVTDAEWRCPITRMAEGITVVALCIGGCMVLIDLGRPERALNLFRFGRIQSPIVWDVLSVSTYLTGCLVYFYLPLLPDLEILQKQADISPLRRRFYRALSLGWTGVPSDWHLLEKAISVMAVAIIPLAISVHTVVSWIFAMTLCPGWDSSIFGPYFVVGAIYSGAAAVVLAMCILRSALRLQAYLEPVHFRNLGLLLLSFSALYLYFNINEYLTVGYKFQGGEKLLLDRLLTGDYAPYFWVVQIVGVALPMLLMMGVLGPKRYRQFTVPGLGLASFLAIVGAWAKRYLIVVPTLSSPFLPIQGVPESYGHYTPSWVEWSITAAAFAAFLLLYTLLAKLFPVVSIWETRPAVAVEPAAVVPGPAFGPRNWRPAVPLPLLLVAALVLLGAMVARAQDKPKGNSGQAQPTQISVTWKALPPQAAPRVEDARATAASPGKLFLSTRGMPELWPSESPNSKREAANSVIEVSAQLRDGLGQPLAYQAVGFTLKTSLGTLDFGRRPTDDEGKVQLVVRDRRYGQYPVEVAFQGDGAHPPSRSQVMVDFGPRPAPALPGGGVLIGPNFSPAIGLPFIFFYGSMWCVMAYVVGYLVLVRMRRERRAGAALSPSPAALSSRPLVTGLPGVSRVHEHGG
jgi:Ni/Fe-hydrogenase subunit HybB-like protein